MIGPEVRGRPAFTLCGLVGTALAVASGLALAATGGADLGVMVVVSAVACAAFLALALAEKVLCGVERLVYYHHLAAVLGVAALVPWAFGEPVLPFLDAAAVGLGVFLACGRVGCLLAGCCHGRPAGRGVRYTAAHAAEGFPAHLVGVPLVPVQALEAAGVLAIAASGAGLVTAGAEPGTALAWYLSGYAALRFGLELLRGDTPRPYLAGLSAAQWTSLAIALGVAAWRPDAVLVAIAIALAAAAASRWRDGLAAAVKRNTAGAFRITEMPCGTSG